MRKSRKCEVYSRENEIAVYFDPSRTLLDESDFVGLAKEIYTESRGRVALMTNYANLGILSLMINLAIKPGSLTGIDENEATERVVKKIEDATM